MLICSSSSCTSTSYLLAATWKPDVAVGACRLNADSTQGQMGEGHKDRVRNAIVTASSHTDSTHLFAAIQKPRTAVGACIYKAEVECHT